MCKIKLYLSFSVILSFIFSSIAVYGQSSANFRIKKWNLSNLAGSAAAPNFTLNESNLGGVAIGKSSSNSFVLNGGMLVTSIKDSLLTRQIFPELFILKQNYPNPFNPGTTIAYGLPKATDVRLQISNALGQLVKMIDVGHQSAGLRQIKWNGTDDFGNRVSSGIYYYQIITKDFTDVKKMLLVK